MVIFLCGIFQEFGIFLKTSQAPSGGRLWGACGGSGAPKISPITPGHRAAVGKLMQVLSGGFLVIICYKVWFEGEKIYIATKNSGSSFVDFWKCVCCLLGTGWTGT